MVLVKEKPSPVRRDARAGSRADASAGDGPTRATDGASGDGRDVGASSGGPFRRLRENVRRRPGGALAWRIGVTVLGVAIIVVGIVLLPLPGPGWLIIFAGLGLLATEYDRAARLLAFAKLQVQRWTTWISGRPRWQQLVISAALLIAVAAFVYGAWVLSRSVL